MKSTQDAQKGKKRNIAKSSNIQRYLVRTQNHHPNASQAKDKENYKRLL